MAHRIYGYMRGIHVSGMYRKADLNRQVRAIKLYTRHLLDFHPSLEIAEVYSDVGIPRAGQKLRSLPGGRKLLLRIHRGDHLLIGHFARAFATPTDCVQNMRIWQQQGIRVHLAQKNLRLSIESPGGQLFLKIMQELTDGLTVSRVERIKARKQAAKDRQAPL